VLHALIFDFLNHRTGRLDPSYEAIARKAGVCVRAVATALARLRERPGVLDGDATGERRRRAGLCGGCHPAVTRTG
jgi:hypothetical protein